MSQPLDESQPGDDQGALRVGEPPTDAPGAAPDETPDATLDRLTARIIERLKSLGLIGVRPTGPRERE